MSFLLAGARLAAPVQMGPLGGSGGCLAFAGAAAKRKTVRLLRSGSGTRRGGGCGGPMEPPRAWHAFCPGIEGCAVVPAVGAAGVAGGCGAGGGCGREISCTAVHHAGGRYPRFHLAF